MQRFSCKRLVNIHGSSLAEYPLIALRMYPKWLAYPMSMFYRCWGLQTPSSSLAEIQLSPKLCILKMSFSSLGLYPFPNIFLSFALMGVMCFDSQHFNFISCWSVHGGSVCFQLNAFLIYSWNIFCHRYSVILISISCQGMSQSMQIFGAYCSKSVASFDHVSFISIIYAH